MRSWNATPGLGIDGLVLREGPSLAPGPGEVLVAVRAVSLSYRELLVLQGRYALPVKPELVPVSDGAGEVVAVGRGVRGAQVGDRVTATLFPTWQYGSFGLEHLAQLGGSLDGMLAELVVLPETALVPVPDHLSFAEAATLPCAGVTAWNSLADVAAGDTVVTLGTGGVSLFAIQLAKIRGARVIATTSTADKADKLREIGADEVVNYRVQPDWPARVRELTEGRGADRLVDVVGDLPQSLRAVAIGGLVALVGFVGGAQPALDPRLLFQSGAAIRTVAVGSRAQFLEMNRAIAVGRMRPVVHRVFTFLEAVDAYRYYEAEQPLGKVVIEVSAESLDPGDRPS